MGELEQFRKAGVDTSLGVLHSLGYFDGDCKDICPFSEYCPLVHLTNEEIYSRLEKIMERTGKFAVIRCPVFLDDVKE